MSPTHRSAAARLRMKKFILEFFLREDVFMRYQHFDSPKYFFRVYGTDNFLLLRSSVHSLVAKTGGKAAAIILYVKHQSSHW